MDQSLLHGIMKESGIPECFQNMKFSVNPNFSLVYAEMKKKCFEGKRGLIVHNKDSSCIVDSYQLFHLCAKSMLMLGCTPVFVTSMQKILGMKDFDDLESRVEYCPYLFIRNFYSEGLSVFSEDKEKVNRLRWMVKDRLVDSSKFTALDIQGEGKNFANWWGEDIKRLSGRNVTVINVSKDKVLVEHK